MPIWLAILLILVGISLILGLFQWIGEHIVTICITIISIILLFFLRDYLTVLIPVLLGIGMLSWIIFFYI